MFHCSILYEYEKFFSYIIFIVGFVWFYYYVSNIMFEFWHLIVVNYTLFTHLLTGAIKFYNEYILNFLKYIKCKSLKIKFLVPIYMKF